jgi:hypothetical protein
MTALVVSMALELALASGASAAEPEQARLAADLAKLSRRRILFGHQSVGRNILDGVERLAESQGITLRVIELQAPGPLEPGALSHAFVGANGDPRSKLAAFGRLLAGTGVDPPDLALMKFCYVDFGPETDAAALFEAYQAALRDLVRSHPRTTFVHLTVPLTTVQSGPKALVKRLLGRQPYGLLENARRGEFNSRLRTAYQGRAPLFDLARLEATSVAGTLVAAEWQGRKIPALDPASTDDGGHLNAAAQDRIARALVGYLASLP